jgi:signal transduction histidine kinase
MAAMAVAHDAGLMRPRAFVALGAATVGCVALWVWLQQASDRPAKSADYWVEMAVAVSCVGAGAAIRWRRGGPVGARLIAAGFLIFLSALLRSNDSWLFSLGNLLSGLGAIVLAHIVVTFPSGRTETRWERYVVAAIYVGGALVLTARATTTDFTTSCVNCPPNRFYLGGYPHLFHVLDGVSVGLLVALNLAVLAALVAKWRRAGPARHRSLAYPYATLLVLIFVAVAGHPGFDNRGTATTASIVFDVVMWLFPISLAVGLFRGHLARAAASDLLVELDHDSDIAGAARKALGDPSARLVCWDPAIAAFVDTDGQRAGDVVAPRRRSVVECDGSPLAAIDHDEALAEEPERLSAVLAAVGLALDRSRLAETVRGHLDEVEASRARIVAAADEERRRIQRDLHDGAQQRIVGVSILVRRARTRALRRGDDELAGLLADAGSELDASLAEIRTLAAGLRPPLLDEHGLLAALDSLAERAPVPTTIHGQPPTPVPPATESAAFFVASECLTNTAKHAAATTAWITLGGDHDALVISVADDGRGGAVIAEGRGLRGLQDRVEALHGTLDIDSSADGGTTITARLPTR